MISRLLPPRGLGLDYVHWNDHNKVVEWLRLVFGSKRARQTRHDNEINCIVEELRDVGMIVYTFGKGY